MGEVKKFPGHPVLSQILDVIPSSIIHAANRKHKSNRYYKRLHLRVIWWVCCMGCLATVTDYGSYAKAFWPVKGSCPI